MRQRKGRHLNGTSFTSLPAGTWFTLISCLTYLQKVDFNTKVMVEMYGSLFGGPCVESLSLSLSQLAPAAQLCRSREMDNL